MLLKEDLDNITQAILLLTKVIKNAGAFEEEQRRERAIAQKLKEDVFKPAIYFTKKEVAKLPTEFQKIINVDLPIRVRKKPNGVFEARFRHAGLNITVSSKRYDLLKAKFLQALEKGLHKRETDHSTRVADIKFSDVAWRWLELKGPTIKDNTKEFYSQLLKASILPNLTGNVADVKQSEIQSLINKHIEEGKNRTALKIYQTVKAIFNFAVGEEIIDKSPMRLLSQPKYEERTGTALSRTEERELLMRIEESKCDVAIKNALRFMLYTGIRRSELASAKIFDGFVSVENAKTRKGFIVKRRFIPITPMLARWLNDMDLSTLNVLRPDALTQAIKRLMPEHHLHELRHTFITRCQECGVPREVVSVWAGHAPDNTMTSNVYTHFSSSFMLEQGQKVDYKV